jgi:hypothetical protein
MRELDRTSNFLRLYLHHCGHSEIPAQWHYWAAMSVLAASVADRVWVQADDARRVRCNLYVMLVGPSGSGKEHAITKAAKLAHEGGGDIINLYAGRATRQHILDRLGKGVQAADGTTLLTNSKLYLVTEELGSSLRTGEHGWELISFMTELYIPPPYPYRDGTRTSGQIVLIDPLLNWLAGSTEQWLKRVVPTDAMEGGFFPRIVTVRGQRDHATRHPKIRLPEDVEEVREHLLWRISGYTWLQGAMSLTPDAATRREQWYMDVPPPTTVESDPVFNRRDEMIHRFAALHALADCEAVPQVPSVPPNIELKHVESAIESWEWIMGEVPKTLRLSKVTPRAEMVEYVRELLQREQQMDRSALLRKVGGRGMVAKDLDDCLTTLIQGEEVEWKECEGRLGKRKVVYWWTS